MHTIKTKFAEWGIHAVPQPRNGSAEEWDRFHRNVSRLMARIRAGNPPTNNGTSRRTRQK